MTMLGTSSRQATKQKPALASPYLGSGWRTLAACHCTSSPAGTFASASASSQPKSSILLCDAFLLQWQQATMSTIARTARPNEMHSKGTMAGSGTTQREIERQLTLKSPIPIAQRFYAYAVAGRSALQECRHHRHHWRRRCGAALMVLARCALHTPALELTQCHW